MTAKKDKWFSLSDLKDDTELVRTLHNDFKQNIKPGKQKPKPSKAKAKQVNNQPTTKDRKYAEVSTVLLDLKQCEALLMKCLKMLGEKVVPYGAIVLTLATAYSKPTTQALKGKISLARKRCTTYQKADAAKERARSRMYDKGLPTAAIRSGLKKYPKIDPTNLLDLIQDSLTLIAESKSKMGGTYYTDRPDLINIDLSEWDTKGDGVVMTRTHLLVGVKQPIDVEKLKREQPDLKIKHMESFLYDFQNALVVGYMPSALPKEVSTDKLRASVANTFKLVANPVPQKLMHPSSKRVWFFVPEFTAMYKYMRFADKELTQEFGGLKLLPVNPTVDEIRLVFTREGFPTTDLDNLIEQYLKIDSARDRSQLLYREFQSFSLRKKSQKLSNRRLAFDEDNAKLKDVIRKLEDDVDTYKGLTKEFRDEFKVLTSPTGKVEDGLPIADFKHIPEVFAALIRSANKGVRDSIQREKTRQLLIQDRLKAWYMYYTYVELAGAAKYAKDQLKLAKENLDYNRMEANGHIEQTLDT